MDEKIKKVLRKLYQVLPEHLRQGWRFDASNIGSSYTSAYGIVLDAHACLGVNIDVSSSLREEWSIDPVARSVKCGAALAAWVAYANPQNIMDLLEENEAMRTVITAMIDHDNCLYERITASTVKIEQLRAQLETAGKVNAEDTRTYFDQRQEIERIRSDLEKAHATIDRLGDALADIIEHTSDERAHDTALEAMKG